MPPATISEHDALPAGTRLGEFEIECVLGVGGFGIVYRALDHALERRVAIKEYMPAALATRGEQSRVSLRSAAHLATFELGLRSFINEAKLLARFDHPSLVKVYRFWEANDTAYMVMPWYEGVTLREARAHMPAPPQEAWLRSLLLPMLGALATLHREQVYHRDIAPDNILLLGDASGGGEARPVLLDFGAARRVIGDHTQTLTAILKPSFAPIEQYAESNGLRQGPWTDLYALAAVLHFCITGRAPLPATTRAVHDELVPLLSMAPGLARDFGREYSPALLSSIDHALAVRPAERPAAAEDWLRELSDSRSTFRSADDEATSWSTTPDGVTRTVVFDPDGRRRTTVAPLPDPASYATTAPAVAPDSALLREQAIPTLPMGPGGGTRAPERTGGSSSARVDPGEDGSLEAGAPAQRPWAGSWMVWALAGMLLVTLWSLWQARRPAPPVDLPAVAASAPADPQAQAPERASSDLRQSSPAAQRQARTEGRPPVPGATGKPGSESAAKSATPSESRSVTKTAPQPAAKPAPDPDDTPRAQCGGKVFIALAVCMKRQCNKPQYVNHPQCVRFREMEEANRERR